MTPQILVPIYAASKPPDSNWYNLINSNLAEFNKRSASLAWKLMVGDDDNGTLENAATILGKYFYSFVIDCYDKFIEKMICKNL